MVDPLVWNLTGTGDVWCVDTFVTAYPWVRWEQVTTWFDLEIAIAKIKAYSKTEERFQQEHTLRLRHYATGDTIPFEALG